MTTQNPLDLIEIGRELKFIPSLYKYTLGYNKQWDPQTRKSFALDALFDEKGDPQYVQEDGRICFGSPFTNARNWLQSLRGFERISELCIPLIILGGVEDIVQNYNPTKNELNISDVAPRSVMYLKDCRNKREVNLLNSYSELLKDITLVSAVAFEVGEMIYGLREQDRVEGRGHRMVREQLDCPKRNISLLEEYKKQAREIAPEHYEQILANPERIVTNVARKFVNKYKNYPLRSLDVHRIAREIYERTLNREVR
jgi:hypothetical protein